MNMTVKLVSFILLSLGTLIILSCSIGNTETQSGHDYFVFLNTNPEREPLDSAAVATLQAGHISNIQRLASEKKLIVAGPFYTGGGIFIFRAPSMDTLNQWLSTDPAISVGRFKLEKYLLITMAGRICETDTNYTMVTYQCTRLKPVHIGQNPLAGSTYRDFLKQLAADSVLIFAGQFDNDYHDGILITNFPNLKSAKQEIAQSTLVVSGDLTCEMKELWIAKESFGPEN
ncbi:MAG: YciI family protein [Candidatus Marinimicrobia bacterium]|nr:YciI family protein [Candidatus Neomarinimicrobiota bacterium]MCF7839910.1 YciI family protein [Candidatus Neomarinimicrobiota bacterium]MCF7903184.1 YciI family protein [Candidatus Neomarinimicrobiota bacterium]